MKTDKDEFGNRMKDYELIEVGRRFMPLLPVIARLDGKNFSNWTKDLKRPYDERMSKVMIDTTKWLVGKTGALTGYTQSDEISLVYYSESAKSQIFFDGRIQKMTSVLASMASVCFNKLVETTLPGWKIFWAYFDCRAWQVPNKTEAVNAILWRELDATKNSVSMAAREYYSHKELQNKNSAQMMDMLMEKGVNWNNYPSFFKRGTYIQKQKTMRKFTPEEIESFSLAHEARRNPDMEVERTFIAELDMPPLGKVRNRIEVIFEGTIPITEEAK